jgi:Protein of unknown function (DUF3738)
MKRILVTGVMLLALTTMVWAVDTKTDYDHSADFTKYRSFAWKAPKVFDVDLNFARDTALSTAAIPGAPVPSTPPALSIPPLPGPPLGIALEDQLGLKLESARMPIEVLVIKSVEMPSEN